MKEHAKAAGKPVSKKKIALSAITVLALAAGYWGLSEAGILSILQDEERLRGWIDGLGLWGPLAIIVLMTAAIVMSPIPSGPLAMVAGAAYGPLWGTVWVVVGAETGALIAFAIARYLGQDAVRRWVRRRFDLDLGRNRSQNALMAIVFISRLVPFISFDAVSYAAGLTPLALWRFAIATIAGVVPIAFLFTYFGNELVSADSRRGLILAILIGGITLVPLALRWLWTRRR